MIVLACFITYLALKHAQRNISLRQMWFWGLVIWLLLLMIPPNLNGYRAGLRDLGQLISGRMAFIPANVYGLRRYQGWLGRELQSPSAVDHVPGVASGALAAAM